MRRLEVSQSTNLRPSYCEHAIFRCSPSRIFFRRFFGSRPSQQNSATARAFIQQDPVFTGVKRLDVGSGSGTRRVYVAEMRREQPSHPTFFRSRPCHIMIMGTADVAVVLYTRWAQTALREGDFVRRQEHDSSISPAVFPLHFCQETTMNESVSTLQILLSLSSPPVS